ncbi:MAG TPA: VWA domain-containing protein [Devosia sp.]|nr:VWA domain-containing protein [Devosia sp.]
MTDEALSSLKSLRAAQPSTEARKLALNAAMVAFDAAQAKTKVSDEAGFFTRLGKRLRNGWIAAPAGAAALAVLLLPVGYQALNSTSMTQLSAPPDFVTATDEEGKERDVTVVTSQVVPLNDTPVKPEAVTPQDAARADQLAAGAATMTTDAQPLVGMPSPAPSVTANAKMRALMPASESFGGLGVDSGIPLQPTGDVFQAFTENNVKVVAQEPVSTFSIDVDTASYAYVRSMLEDGFLPSPDAVRLEELINYFPYDYQGPASMDVPFKANMAVIPTPWNSKTELLEIGIKGYVPPAEDRKPQNLTFLIDTSGSMDEPNKLPLLQRSFELLLDQLEPEDTVAIVTYAGSAGLLLEPTKAKDRPKIKHALMNLMAGGSTAGAEGIALAYDVAEEGKVAGSVNRVILATDGDFNVGISDPEELKTYIKQKRDSGVFLSVLGFGRGNLDDTLMQALAQNGNGNASYIDSFREAKKVLVEEGGANLVTIAKDVKIQVEFNPAVVSEYRLIGYETRALNREDFNNDAVDAGEIGAGHTVTALYEITPVGSGAELNDPLRYGAAAGAAAEAAGVSDEIGFLKMRYKAPDGDVSKLITAPIGKDLVVGMDQASTDQKFAAAVAAFGQKLKGSNYGSGMSWQQIADLANAGKGVDMDGYRAELVQLISMASLLNPDKSAGGRTVCDDPSGGKGDCPATE